MNNDQQRSVDEVIKQLVLAHNDQEIKSIAAVTINYNGEVELHIGLNMGDGYKIVTGFELMKLQLCLKMMKDGSRSLGDRE